MCQGQLRKTPLLKPGEYGIFYSFCPYFSTHPSLKLGTPIPTQKAFLELARQWLYSQKVLMCYLQNCGHDRLSWKQKIFSSFMFSVSLKIPLKPTRARVPEIMGGGRGVGLTLPLV